MPVASNEIKWFKSAAVSNEASNGGRMSNNEITTAVKNAIFPDASQSERTAGSTKHRKVFIKNVNATNLQVLDAKIFVENYSPGQDALLFFPGDQTDIQSDLTGSERVYGCGKLDANVSAGATSITVLTEDADLDYIQDGDTIRISDKSDINGAGNEEYVVVDGTVSYVGDVATVPLATPLLNSYTAAASRVASVYEPGAIAPTVSAHIVTSAAGTLAADSITGDNRGSIEQNWLLTFTSPTAFGVVGDTVGSVGTGTTSGDFEPANAGAGGVYFSIDFTGFGGSFLNGDTITFTTTPAAIPLWYKRVIPAASAAQSNNTSNVGVDFESE